MKTYKYLDLCTQTACLAFGIINAARRQNSPDMLNSYYIVGAANVLSCILHAVLGYNQRKGSPRFYYNRLLLFIPVAMLITLPFLLCSLFVLLIVSPFMALFYYWITWTETKALYKNEKTESYEIL